MILKGVCNRILPINPYDRNLKTADKASSVTGPDVSSDRITSRNGPKSHLCN